MTHPFIHFQNGSKGHFTTYNHDGNGRYTQSEMLIKQVAGERIASIDEAEARIMKLLDEKLEQNDRFSFIEMDHIVRLSNGRVIPHIGTLVFEVNRAIVRVAMTSRRGRANHLMMSPKTFDRFKWACGTFNWLPEGDAMFRPMGSGWQGEGAPEALGWTMRGEAFTKDAHNPIRVYTHPGFRENTILTAFKGDRMDGPAAIIDGEDGLKLCLNEGSVTQPQRYFSLVTL